MTPEEIINVLREVDADAKASEGDYYADQFAWHGAGEIADAVEQMAAEIARLREERRWVPVGERSPELLQNVLVCSIRGIHFASLDLCGQWLDEDENPGKKISHWQPLPPGPEAKEPNRE